MIKKLMMSVFLISVVAKADPYPILAQYNEKAESIIGIAQTVQRPEQVSMIRTETRSLMEMGVEVMKLYAVKNPACTEQFNAFITELPRVESMTEAEAHARFHNGEGLPVAPRHCYFGRSQVIHPALDLIRLKDGAWSEAIKESIIGDLEEVIEHSARIQQNLDHPPAKN